MTSSACDRELMGLTDPSVFLKQNLWEIYFIIGFLHGALFFGTTCISKTQKENPVIFVVMISKDIVV